MLIAHHQENLHNLLGRLGPVSGWQLVVMSQIISTLSQKKSIEEFFISTVHRHNLFDESSANHFKYEGGTSELVKLFFKSARGP